MKKDYYEILGITDEEKKLKGSEFNKIAKSKMRKLALEYHPDKQKDKSDEEKKLAEEKFKEINEAYSVLSNETKREEYDLKGSGFNFNGFDGANHFNENPFDNGNPFGSWFDDFFNDGSFGFGGKTNKKKEDDTLIGADLRINLNFTLEDAYFGKTKTIKYKRYKPCPTCNNVGHLEDGRLETCNLCNGSGKVYHRNGIIQTITTCPKCNGMGKIIVNPCKTCGGAGVVLDESTIQISIPKGALEGMTLRYSGNGHTPSNILRKKTYLVGAMIVVLHELNHETFHRNGNDLIVDTKVGVIDAILGCDVNVKTLDSSSNIKIKVKELTKDGTVLRVKGKGMPIYESDGYGDLYVKIDTEMPTKLNDDERKALEDIKKMDNFK